jgi:hypothetical protein
MILCVAAGMGWLLIFLIASVDLVRPQTLRADFRVRIFLLFAAGAVLRVTPVVIWPEPPIDVFVWLREAPSVLLQGHNPYVPENMSQGAEIRVEGQTYSAYRESLLAGTFVLQLGERTLARARKASVFVRAFDIDLAGQPIELKAASVWRREFGLFENGEQVGRISPTGWFSWQAVLDLPPDIPLLAQLFLFWLVLVLWRRAAADAAGS